MSVSVFALIKNESQFIGYSVMSLLPYVDEFCYGDGNSTDGTLELLDYIKKKYDPENKIKVFRDFDFSDFKDDYVKKFNEIMNKANGGYKFYCHPDMILTDPGQLVNREKWKDFAYFVYMRSFAGEDMDLEIIKGRTNKWKTIMKNGFGLHYWGYYGDQNEDMYFKAITGDTHRVYQDMRQYPFQVGDSGVKISHFCECKPRARREEKMKTVFKTVGLMKTDDSEIHEFDLVSSHPRVHLQNHSGPWGSFEFTPRKDALPDVFEKHKQEFDEVLGRKLEDIGSVAGA